MKKLYLLIVVVAYAGCAYLGTPQGQALLATSEGIASVAVQAAAIHYGGAAAGQLAGSGLDALATVLQGYINKPVPPAIVKASPGIQSVANAVAPLVSTKVPIAQTDVNAVWKAAAIATKK